MKKGIFLILILFLFSVCMNLDIFGANGYVSSSPYIKVVLVNQEPDPAQPGDVVEVKLKVENYGSETDKLQLRITPISPLKLDASTPEIIDLGKMFSVQTGSDAMILKLNFGVDSEAFSGNAKFKLAYNVGGSWIEFDEYLVEIKHQDVLLDVPSIEVSPEEGLLPGERGTIKITLENQGKSDIRDISLKLNLDVSLASTIDSSDYRNLGILEAGEKKEFEFNVAISPRSEAGLYNVPLNLKYENADRSESYEKDLSFGLFVLNKDKLELSILSNNIEFVESKGQITLSIANIGTSSIKFLNLELLEDDSYQILSSTKQYIGNLEPDDYESFDYDLYVNEENLSLKFRVNWVDVFNNEHSEVMIMNKKIMSKDEAISLGIVQENKSGKLTNIIFLIITSIFWIFMLEDVIMKKTKNKVKKNTWLVIVLFTHVLGATLYLFFGKRNLKSN